MTVTTTRPAPGESLTAWAKRCAEQERLASRSERGTRLLALLQRVLTWPADRVSVVHGPGPEHATFAQVDGLLFRVIPDAYGEHLCVSGQVNDWHHITSAADLGELMRSGKLQGVGA